MLKEIQGNEVKVGCFDCGVVTPHDVTDIEVKYLEEFREYQNVKLRCSCGTDEVFNVNIPINDTDEDFQTGELPVEEEIQRHYVRILQRLVRADFKGGNS